MHSIRAAIDPNASKDPCALSVSRARLGAHGQGLLDVCCAATERPLQQGDCCAGSSPSRHIRMHPPHGTCRVAHAADSTLERATIQAMQHRHTYVSARRHGMYSDTHTYPAGGHGQYQGMQQHMQHHAAHRSAALMHMQHAQRRCHSTAALNTSAGAGEESWLHHRTAATHSAPAAHAAAARHDSSKSKCTLRYYHYTARLLCRPWSAPVHTNKASPHVCARLRRPGRGSGWRDSMHAAACTALQGERAARV